MNKSLKWFVIAISAYMMLAFVTGCTKTENKLDQTKAASPAPPEQSAKKEPLYTIDGAYPGMTADQAKSVGYTECRNAEAEKDAVPDVLCSKPSAQISLFGIPVDSVSIRFIKPFDVADSVIVIFKDPRKYKKECQPTKGQWGDVISGECKDDIEPAITQKIGHPIGTFYSKHSGRTTVWHKCGSDSLSFHKEFHSANIKTPNMVVVRTGLDKINAEQCAAASAKKAEEDRLEAEKQKKLAESKSFIDKMK